jgi:hypothetical protein
MGLSQKLFFGTGDFLGYFLGHVVYFLGHVVYFLGQEELMARLIGCCPWCGKGVRLEVMVTAQGWCRRGADFGSPGLSREGIKDEMLFRARWGKLRAEREQRAAKQAKVKAKRRRRGGGV